MTRRSLIALLALVTCLAGCDWWKPPADSSYDGGRAKEVLVDALETWKQGKAGTLASRQPPVRFVDDDLVAGFALLEYRLVSPDQTIAPYDLVPVVIKVKSGNQVIERSTVYQVSLEPKIAVLRAE